MGYSFAFVLEISELQKGGIVLSCINFQKFIEIGSIKRKVRSISQGERVGNKIRPEVRRI